MLKLLPDFRNKRRVDVDSKHTTQFNNTRGHARERERENYNSRAALFLRVKKQKKFHYQDVIKHFCCLAFQMPLTKLNQSINVIWNTRAVSFQATYLSFCLLVYCNSYATGTGYIAIAR